MTACAKACDMSAHPECCDECIVCEAIPMAGPDSDIPLHNSIYLLKCDGDQKPEDGL